MNLQPINPPEPVFRFDCYSCGRPFLSTTPGACANLDGTSFAAYFCGACASVIQDAARDLAESPAYGTANDSEIGPEIYPATNYADLQREHDAADASLRLERPEYPLLGSEEMSRARAARVRSLRTIGKAGACAVLAAFLSLPAFAAPQPCRINVNAAGQIELQLFARTGPALAGRLASGRPYKDLSDVDAVKGVGEAWLVVNGPHVTFSGETTCTEKVPSPRVPKIAAQAPKL